MSLFDTAAEITRPLGVAKPAPSDLKSYEYDDLGLGWCIHVGYTYTQELGELPDVWIHKLELNTGQHLIPLSLTDIPGADLKAIEAAIADEIDGSNQAAAESLARDPRDDGDYAHDRALDTAEDKL